MTKEKYSHKKWVNIETKLPVEDSVVICWCGNGYRFCEYKRRRFCFWWTNNEPEFVILGSKFQDVAEDVTHWVYPLPPPGKE